MKRLLSLTVALVLVFSLCAGISVSAEKPVTVTVDGQPVNFDVQPRLIGGRTMVPLRAIFEALGATVEWDEESQTVTAYNEVYIVKCTIDSNTMYVNNEAKTIDVAPMMINSRTLVPARFVAEAFNCNVSWDNNTFVVTITSNPIDYSKVEQDTIYTETPATMAPDTVYEPTADRYYPGTNVPDYTYVTGIEQKYSPHYNSDNGLVTYCYRKTKIGEYYEVVEYIEYLEKNGWSLYDEEKDDTSISWYYVKNEKMICVCCSVKHDEIWIIIT